MLFFYPSLSPPQFLICLFLIISYFVIICTIIITKNNADHISTICVIPLMSSWNIYSIFFQSLLQIYSILKICYDILRYSMIPFLWGKMSANLDFKRTFQYFQALYSVVRISSQLFPNNVYKSTGFIKASRDPSATQLIWIPLFSQIRLFSVKMVSRISFPVLTIAL